MKPCPRCGSPIGQGNDICIACHMKEQREVARQIKERKNWPACEVVVINGEQRFRAEKLLEKALGEDWEGL